MVCVESDRSAAQSRLEEVASRLLSGLNVRQVVITANNVEREIVRYAAESNADVVMVNARREIGTVKQDIIRRIATPVMVVP
jgi:diaminopimelate decarboxylase